MANDAPTVLIVDDDPVTRLLVRRGVGALGEARVLEAEDGVEAQQLLRAHDVDLVITDLLMPRLDGMGLIRWANQHAPGPVWIILSGRDSFDAAVDAIHAGAFDFLAKPPRLEELEVAVRNALAHQRLLRERERLFQELAAANAELSDRLDDLEEKSAIIRRDLARAEVIQRALLPAGPPPLEGYCLNALYRPGAHVGGDLYQVARIGPRHLSICVADATGHGVSSAMLSVLFHRRLVLRDDAGAPLAPGVVLARVNRALCADAVAPGLFLTAAVLLLELDTGNGAYAAAGHPPALLRTAGGATHRLPRTGPALGLAPGAAYGETRVRLAAGDRMLLFTDGLIGDRGAERLDELEAAVSFQVEDRQEWLRWIVADSAPAEEADRDDTTVLLLEAGAGDSCFDNGVGSAAAAPLPARAGASEALWYGESESACHLAVRGRATWTDSDAFMEAASAILEARRPLVLDLRACDYLDSTFLGTIHELVAHKAGRNGLGVCVCVGPGPVRHAFEELSMRQVLEAVDRDAAEPPPDMLPIAVPVQAADSRERVLRAHQTLAALSERNRRKFAPVIQALRRDPT